MTTAQVFQESIRTTIFGMGLVLLTLFVLSLILDLMRIIFAPRVNIKKNEAIEAGDTAAKIQTENITSDSKDDTQLIAVITAALAAYLDTPISSIKVGTIRKIHEKTPIWGMESRIYNINNKL
ncbi:MAG: OadG family protein [Tepidanaerobacteraceae bacterium]|nr:OadG family protein [Tepidanaerobacteraceae bacterium]